MNNHNIILKLFHQCFNFVFDMKNQVHEILNAHKHKNILKNQLLSCPDKPGMLCFLLINVKML